MSYVKYYTCRLIAAVYLHDAVRFVRVDLHRHDGTICSNTTELHMTSANLKVSNDRVALPAEVDEVGVGVVEREHDAVARVDLHRHDGLAQCVGCAQSVLTL